MKPKNLVQLLSLSTSLYMLTKDEELMNKIGELGKKGAEKINGLYESFNQDDDEQLTEKIARTLKTAKDELNQKIEEAVIAMYDKANIAHTSAITKLQNELADLKKELALAEARIVNLESKK